VVYKDIEVQAAYLKQYHVNWCAERKTEFRAKIDKLKQAPCTDCGLCFDPICMDFDHVGNNKIAKVSALVKSTTWAKIQAEIDKCELVCSNCHRIRTRNRLEGTVQGSATSLEN
jgi:hypothetical protein